LIVARSGHTATVLPDGGVLIVGGANSAGQPIAEIEKFHPDTGRVEAVGDVGLPARAGHTATLMMDGRVLIVGGIDVSSLVHGEAQLLDPQTWRFEEASRTLAQARFEHGASLLPGDDVLVWGGRDQERQPITSAEIYSNSSRGFSTLEDADDRRLPVRAYAAMEPKVSASTPQANATNVPVVTRIAVRFSKPLAPGSLNADTVTLIGPGGATTTNVVPAESGQLLFVTPMQQLLPGSTYTLFIQGARDNERRALPFTAIKFETAVLAAAPVVPRLTSARPLVEEVLSDADGELWVPGVRNLSGVWRSGRAPQALRNMPKRSALAKTLYGKNVSNGLPSAPSGVTAVAGQALKLNGAPLAGVTLSIGSQQALTDANGEFLLANVPAGAQTLVIDGSSADKGKRHYGRYEYRAVIEAGMTNPLPFVIWMTRLDTRHEVTLPAPTSSEVIVTNPRIPGLELRIPAGTVIRDARGNIATQISMTAIPVDQPPFPLPNSFVPVYFTVQPGGAHLQGLTVQSAKGARLIYPNFSNAPPGSRMDFWNYDSHEKGWYVYGQGAVSADGKQIVPDQGVVIYEFTGAMIAVPNTAPPEGPGSCAAGGAGGGGGSGGPPSPSDSGPSEAGDPVDCFTGLFLHRRTDLRVNDVIPISISRTYRPRDSIARAFGIGTSLSYDMFLIGDTSPWSYQDLILPDGGRVHYYRTSSGTSYANAVYTTTSTPGPFFGSVIRYNTAVGQGWLLTLRDGTVYTFPEAYQVTSGQCSAPIGMSDRNGNALVFTRDSTCNLTRITSPSGRRLNLTYDTSNRVTQATDDAGRTVTYQYDSSGRLASVTDAENKTESYTYDSQHRMLTVTDKRGNTMVTNVYDANGRVSQQTYADNTSSSFSYTLDSNNKVTQMDYTDERGVVKRVQFNTAGHPMTITRAVGEPEQQVISFVRNATTNLVQSRTDAMGRVSTYQYDAKGNTTQVIELAGTSEAATWNYTYEPDFSQLASETDPLNHTVTFGHDAKGNVTSRTDALGHQTSFTYDDLGQLRSATQYLGSTPVTTQYSYLAGILSEIEDPLGRRTQFHADRVGRTVIIKNAENASSHFAYDKLDRLTRTTNELGHETTLTYDGNGNLLTFEDALGNTTQFSYDARNRLSTKTDPLLGVESYLYDEIGNRTRMTDRKGQVTGHAYDALNRIASAGFGATIASPTSYASTVTYTWDGGNRLTGAIDSLSGTIERAFDGLDRLTQEHNPQGQIDYTYYANGLRHTMTVQGQPIVNYTYDDANRLTQISQASATVGIAYDSMSRRSVLTLPNGIDVSYGYDEASRLTSLVYRNGGGSFLGNLTYGYDAVGRRVSMGGTFASVTLPGAIPSASYDGANRQTTWGTRTLDYDDNGALISITDQAAVSYLWDERQRLKEIQQGGVMIASFQYDAFNRRTARLSNGIGTNYLNDGWQVVQELSGTTPIANILAGPRLDEIFRRTAGAVTEDFLVDALGSTIALTDGTGVIQSAYSYEPYGATAASGAASSSAYEYTGRENDGELYYYRNRYYNPNTQRFISEDPLGFAAGSNLYNYVGGDPISNVDPLGLEGIPDPNGVVPGGPWKPADGQRPGDFWGPKKAGPRDMCRWVPAEADGGPPGSQGYWKTQTGGQKGWSRFDRLGIPISPEQAHPNPRPSRSSIPVIYNPIVVAAWALLFSQDAY
jgi:RHS repeat-associated protein